jgi:integrase|tara:strand:- start:984 stop:1571 length:588 start_codon:yes stop_codon:yes gene_type:complete
MNEVSAVKSASDIIKITELLCQQTPTTIYADIWCFGIQVGLRISDILQLEFDEIMDRDKIFIIEQKSKNEIVVVLNDIALAIINERRRERPDDKYLFQATGNRAKSLEKPISRSTVARKFAEVGEIIGINLGTHSMRKTRGYMLYSAGYPLSMIKQFFNHKNVFSTLRYIGIQITNHEQHDQQIIEKFGLLEIGR